MRVGIDYLPAVAHAPGVGRYAREMVRAAVRCAAGPELALFEWGSGPRAMEGPPLGLDNARLRVRRRRFPLPRRALTLGNRWLRLGADDLLGGVDVFHRILPEQPPVRRAPQVLPIAELPPPGTPADLALAEAVRRAAATAVFCGHYALEVPRRYGVDPASVAQVSVGSEHWVRDLAGQAGDAPAAKEMASHAKATPRILVLGALRAERRPELALAGFERLRAGGAAAQLCLVGRPAQAAQAFREALDRSPVAADVRWIDDPVESQMPSLVAGSSVLLHLAQDEGSPVTPLEACAMGLAVAAERLPAFEEALGNLGSWMPRDPSAEQVADALAAALALTHERSARIALAQAYTWTRCAEQHFALWEAVAAGKPPGPVAR